MSAFSVLRPASELAIARAFARLDAYHDAFTSCNTIFRLDPDLRGGSWCCDCPKCRFVYLALAPFSTPEQLREIFGRDLLAEEHQFEGFALLCARRGPQAVRVRRRGAGEPGSLAAAGPRSALARAPVVRRLVAEVLPRQRRR